MEKSDWVSDSAMDSFKVPFMVAIAALVRLIRALAELMAREARLAFVEQQLALRSVKPRSHIVPSRLLCIYHSSEQAR